MGPALAGFEPRASSVLTGFVETHRLDEKVGRCGSLGDRHRHRVEPSDGVILVDRALSPRYPRLVGRGRDELQLDAVRVGHDDDVRVEPGLRARLHAELAQPAGPEIARLLWNRERHGGDLAGARPA